MIECTSDLAEIRRAKETASFFLELTPKEQIEWAYDLKSRIRAHPDPWLAVCVLDTGANNGHVLLQPLLADPDCQSVDPEWGVNDHDGHGTLMCGVAAFGDLTKSLQHTHPVRLEHCIESVKILPPQGTNDPDLYGDVTFQGISRATIQAPKRVRIACMAVTSQDGRDRGRPSSWSAALDQITSAPEDDSKQLFIVSAGNVDNSDEWFNYPRSNLNHSVHDPGQSWNALTVGAYTEKACISDSTLEDYSALACPGQLSPFSSTSAYWERKWPIKPDIVLEGGNLAKAPDGFISGCDDFSMLSTSSKPTLKQFDAINATSAATAQAAWMAAQIQAKYPNAWPETIRGLIIHSAKWSEALKQQFLTRKDQGEYSKSDYGHLLRICGYGVPQLERAMASAANSLTLLAESQIQPYCQREGRPYLSTKDMNLHRFPWPREVLLDLGERAVELRITLSYFIEPAPGEVGWKDKYRYASYGLRFGLNSFGETEADFLKRLNQVARDEGEKPETISGSERWMIGSEARDTGSVHSDVWRGTAAEIASCNLIGVYPVTGWWKTRAWLGKGDRKARYSLIVSLHTPDERIDIYTPVAIQLRIPIDIPL